MRDQVYKGPWNNASERHQKHLVKGRFIKCCAHASMDICIMTFVRNDTCTCDANVME